MNVLFILCLIFECVSKIAVGDTITDYFVSDTFKTFQRTWQVEKKSFENALVLILEQNYGVRGMNVYVRKMSDFYKISDGFYFSDNVVDVVLLKMYLQELPDLVAANVNFALASNFLRIEAALGKMIITTEYVLIRNQSVVTYTVPGEELNKKSPFSFQQVQDFGLLTIVADDCYLDGYVITSLSGDSVNLGVDTFKIKNCKFSIEIYTEGVGSPPVMAQYFTKSQREALERLLRKPIHAELMPKLQAAIYTYVNSSAIFQEKLADIRLHQNKLFKETLNYVNNMVKNFISNTVKDNHGIVQLKPFEVTWNKACMNGPCKTIVNLKNMILYGLDTAYSAHTGGPYKVLSVNVVEAIRFSIMQVRGRVSFENATIQGEHDFAVELRDVEVRVEMNAVSSSFALVPTSIDVVGWRAMEFSIMETAMFASERRASESFITGYLINEIPKHLVDQLSRTFGTGKQAYIQNRDKSKDDLTSQGSYKSKEEETFNEQESSTSDENIDIDNDMKPKKQISEDYHRHPLSSDTDTRNNERYSDTYTRNNEKEITSSESSDSENKAAVSLGDGISDKEKKIEGDIKQTYVQKLQHPSDNEIKK